MDTLALLAAVWVLGAIVLGLVAFQRATASPREGITRRLDRIIVHPYTARLDEAVASAGFRSKRRARTLLGLLVNGRAWADDVAEGLERADLNLTVSEFVALRMFMAGVFATLPIFLLSGLVAGFAAMLLAGMGFHLPRFWVAQRARKRLAKLDAQLPDTLTMLSNSLKSGFGLMQSLDLASRELAHPMSSEIRRLLQDINVGMTTDEALSHFGKRSGSSDLDIVVTAMLIQQSTGGNLAEILDTVGHTMRERIRIRGEIKTLTTQQMMTGYVIGGLPVAIALAVSVLNPSYIEPLFTTLPGQLMLGGAAVLEFFGVMVIKKILAIEV